MIKYIIVAASVFLMGCADSKIINYKEYKTYGFLNKDEIKDPNIKYRLSIGNVIWSTVLIETIFMPVYFVGFSLYEPVGLKETKKETNKCQK